MNIIDSHLHLPVRDNLSSLLEQRDELLKQLERENISYGIVIPDNIEHSPIGNLKQCLELFSEVSNISVLGTVDILEDNLSEKLLELEEYFIENKIVGLKIFPGHDEHYPNDRKLEPFIRLCVKFNKPLMIHTGENSGDSICAKYNDPKYIVEIAKKYPTLKIIISHLYWPKVKYCVEITKEFSNIAYDTSALADEEVVEMTGEENIKNCLEDLINKYNKKVIYGSDYGMCNIAKHLELIKGLDITKEKREDIYSNNSFLLFGIRTNQKN